jgi:hypothetical protein
VHLGDATGSGAHPIQLFNVFKVRVLEQIFEGKPVQVQRFGKLDEILGMLDHLQAVRPLDAEQVRIRLLQRLSQARTTSWNSL